MIRLPDGTEIKTPARGRVRIVDGAQFPERDLFKPSVMAAKGIKRIVREGFNAKYFISTGEIEVEAVDPDGVTVATVTPTIQRKMTVAKLAKLLGVAIKAEGLALYYLYKAHYDELTDANGLLHDPVDPYVAEFETYRADLKTAYQAIRSAVLDIVNSGETDAVRYQSLIDFDWSTYWPETTPTIPEE